MSGRQIEDSVDRSAGFLRFADVLILVAALPVFLIAGLPMTGYVVCAAVWLTQRGVQEVAERRAQRLLEQGNRKNAMGVVAATTMGRVWLVALSILLVGKLADREDGLAAAVLTLVLVTVYFTGLGLSKMFEPEAAPTAGPPTAGAPS